MDRSSAVIKVVSLFVFMLTFSSVLSASCNERTDCTRCITIESGWSSVSCRWCPITRECHAWLSWHNDCSGDIQVTAHSDLTCAKVAEPTTLSYSPDTAEEMARWSSLAYTEPRYKSLTSMQGVVKSEFGNSYRVLEYVFHGCAYAYEYEYCAALVAISEAQQHLVVAFRGTSGNRQPIEQALSTFGWMVDFGYDLLGKVFSYNLDTHNRLYPCVKSIVMDQLATNPHLRVSVTGHSFGGAQATLTALHLRVDHVVSQSKLELYTFGQPRVGDKYFANTFDTKMGNSSSWRVTNKADPIPKIKPPGLLFAYHTRREVYYNTNSITKTTQYRVCHGNEDDACTEQNVSCVNTDDGNCIEAHNKYFVSDLPTYMDNLVDGASSGEPEPGQGTRGLCSTRVISP